MPDVALISPYPQGGATHAGFSGVASYTANLARSLAGAGAEVTVIADEIDGEPTRTTDGPITVERRFRRGPFALWQAARAATELDLGVIHLQLELFLYGGPAALVSLAPALAELRAHRRGPVVTLHQVLDPAGVNETSTRLHRVPVPVAAVRLALTTLHQTVGRLAASTIVHEAPFQATIPRATVIPHGIEERPTPPRDEARAELGVDSRLCVLCFGFVAPYKGLELALAAAELAGPDVEVVVAGGEHPRLAGRDPYVAGLRERYGDSGRFTGWVAEEDVPRWFAAADVALLPYPQAFSSSGVLALALAHRTPVLLSPSLARCVGAPTELTVPRDPAALADSLLALAVDPDRLKALAGWTEALADGRSWPAVARQHVNLYEEVIDGQRRAA